jgi:HlyD family secretion protein
MTEASLKPSISKSPPRRRRRARKWIKRGIYIVAGLGLIALLTYAWMPKPVLVEVAVVRHGALEVVVEGDGKTRIRDRFVITSPINGMLERIELEPGDDVRAAAPVAYVEPPDPAMLDERTRAAAEARISAAVTQQRQADTAITRARASRDNAVREARRVRALVAGGALAGAELERAELAEQVAQADLRQAELSRGSAIAELATARAALGYGIRRRDEHFPVTSPINGKVLRVLRDSAGPVVAGAPLVELGDPHDLEVVLDVLSSEAAQIAIDAPAVIENWGGAPLTGRVRRIEPSAFTQVSALGIEEQRVNVIVSVIDPPARLGDGFRVEARIAIWRSDNVLVVPASTLFRDHDRWAVYVVEGGVAKLQTVEVGHRGRNDVEIVGGLEAEEQVILHPGDRVADGKRVAIQR